MTQATAARRPTKAWWKELWVQVMVAMALGIALGVWRPDLGAQMQPFGDAFIKAMDTMVIPSDMFGSPEATFGPKKRLGNEFSRLSQLQDARWKVVSDYVKN